MSSVYDTLVERGFIEQCTHEKELRELLEKEKVTFYIGFDATADSLTAGHFLTIMAMMHMQKAGHRPIALLGGGTTMIGDPSMRSDMRQMMTIEQIQHNASCFKEQLSHFISFDNDGAILENNANWLLDLNYVNFLRDVGIHFSVNKMLTAECYKSRMEQGLTFFEFNYMLMQSYDFLELNRRYDCCLEMGGNDQWSNILGGVDLIRRKEQKPAYGLTFKLLTTSDGKKMGKTQKGAVWLDPAKTSPYDFYQYWRNVSDPDAIKFMKLFTFMPLDEIKEYEDPSRNINDAKARLAYEITKIIHGEEEAEKAKDAAAHLFSKGEGNKENVPTVQLDKALFENGIGVLDLFTKSGLTQSNGDARRLVVQGGAEVNGNKISDPKMTFTLSDADGDGDFMLKAGKKKFMRVQPN